jgi:hypothetical protein
MSKGVTEKLALLVAGTAAGLIIIEMIMRLAGFTYPILYRPDPFCGSALREGAEGWYRGETQNFIRINRAGLRDREHQETKPPGTFRIAVLGDSYAEAFQVPIERTFWWILQDELSRDPRFASLKFEVINFGVSGYGTAQELQTLRHRVWAYSPDLILLAFLTGNDIRNNSRALERDERMPYFVHRGNDLVLDDRFMSWYESRQGAIAALYYAALDHSCVLRGLKAGRHELERLRWAREREGLARSAGLAEAGLDEIVYKEPPDDIWKEAWSITEDLLTLMNREVKARGARFMVVTLSNGDQVNPDASRRRVLEKELGVGDLFYPERRIKAVADREAFPVLLLAPVLQQNADRTGVYLHGFGDQLGSGHWNLEGHRLAGQLIARSVGDLLRSVVPGSDQGPFPGGSSRKGP